MENLYYFILVPMVYLAFAVFFGGTAYQLVRIWRRPANPVPLHLYPKKRHGFLNALSDTFLLPTVLRRKPLLWGFLMAFHICLLLTIVGHLELFADIKAIQVIPHQIFLGGGFLGLILSICLLYFLGRRFFSPVRDISVPEDYFLLILLFLVVLFGSEMDWARNWFYYSTMYVEDYREYLMSLLTLKPVLSDTITGSGHTFMLVLHVLFANLFLMAFPFSKIMHAFLALPVNQLKRG